MNVYRLFKKNTIYEESIKKLMKKLSINKIKRLPSGISGIII